MSDVRIGVISGGMTNCVLDILDIDTCPDGLCVNGE